MLTVRPTAPELQYGHPFIRGNSSRIAKVLLPAHERGGSVLRNFATGRGVADATVSSNLARVSTPDGYGLAFNGTSDYLSLPATQNVDSAARGTVWIRYILRVEPTSGNSSGFICQWNDPSAGASWQLFNLGPINNLGGRPAHSIDFNAANSGAYATILPLTYAVSDLGTVWTSVGTWDGATLAHMLFLPGSAQRTSTAWATVPHASSGTTVLTNIGRVGTTYANMVLLGAGVWTNWAATFAEAARLHTDPWGMFTPPRPPVVRGASAGAPHAAFLVAGSQTLGTGIY